MASRMYTFSADVSKIAAIAASAWAPLISPSVNASCSFTSGALSPAIFNTRGVSFEASVRNGSLNRSAAARIFGCGSESAALTVGSSIWSRPCKVQSTCSRTAGSFALAASFFKAGATVASPLSTSIRCAVSRHQPFG